MCRRIFIWLGSVEKSIVLFLFFCCVQFLHKTVLSFFFIWIGFDLHIFLIVLNYIFLLAQTGPPIPFLPPASNFVFIPDSFWLICDPARLKPASSHCLVTIIPCFWLSTACFLGVCLHRCICQIWICVIKVFEGFPTFLLVLECYKVSGTSVSCAVCQLHLGEHFSVH